MSKNLHRHQLIHLVTKIVNGEGPEEEINDWISMIAENVPHPNISDLIFYSDEEMTPEQIVDKALSHRPIRL